MSQTTLDNDDLFGEAASEMRADVESHLEQARETLPDPDDVWELEADNTLGALNALRAALSAEGAEEHLRDAKKWYTMGERADAFEDADDLEAEIEAIEGLLVDIETAREQVSDLAGTIPALRSTLQDLHDEEATDGGEDVDEEAAEADAEEEEEEAEGEEEAEEEEAEDEEEE